MWLLHWWEGQTNSDTQPRPPEYRNYQYIGVRTFLTLPEVRNIGQEVIELKTLGFYSLPDFDWTTRAIEEGRLIAVEN